jgi:hypothetical protein
MRVESIRGGRESAYWTGAARERLSAGRTRTENRRNRSRRTLRRNTAAFAGVVPVVAARRLPSLEKCGCLCGVARVGAPASDTRWPSAIRSFDN